MHKDRTSGEKKALSHLNTITFQYFNMITVLDHIRFALRMQTSQVDLSETSLPKSRWRDQLQKRRENRASQKSRSGRVPDEGAPPSRKNAGSLSSKIPQYQ